MARRRHETNLKAPFLKRIGWRDGNPDSRPKVFPFGMPLFSDPDLEVTFERPLTIFVGENGSGKSTLLEAIGDACGFNLNSGGRNHLYGRAEKSALMPHLRLSWLPKVTEGFFMRAESFFNLATYVDEIGVSGYGDGSLHERSHGEAFMALFENRFRANSILILDEPEAALSPKRQLAFLRLLSKLLQNNVQVIMATHSPLLMAYPGADLRLIDQNEIRPVTLQETDHFEMLRQFFDDPSLFLAENDIFEA